MGLTIGKVIYLKDGQVGDMVGSYINKKAVVTDILPDEENSLFIDVQVFDDNGILLERSFRIRNDEWYVK